ncbi:metallophosphoesterase [Nitratireductor indicus C115]|uniref:Metallophosphoesterase n=1 Tax=Nitratireductor indicus C115 TaxID=1231190 RepID=K2NSS8_9HYPH|nr:metallophosphoesterase [Nitratireductor indicus]EKF42410.1 metallophosphoesterase [Nitratireductor indicus C115]SFQ55711.1 Predicted phosphohydrolase [Nitratireductor indicus]
MNVPRLWVLSDLHLETIPYPNAFQPQRPDFDVMVVAGDVWQGDCRRAFQFLAQLSGGKPVVFVLGNHEHWNGALSDGLAMARTLAIEHGVTLLEGETISIAGCRFIGTTLWTDYALSPEAVDPRAETGEQIDIKHDGGRRPITVGDAIMLHADARANLEKSIAEADGDLPVVVITHHAPHPECLPFAHRNTWSAGNSASDLSHLTDSGRIALWVHGHIHASVDMIRPNGTRILCNPAGSMFSNPAFDEAHVVEIGN